MLDLISQRLTNGPELQTLGAHLKINRDAISQELRNYNEDIREAVLAVLGSWFQPTDQGHKMKMYQSLFEKLGQMGRRDVAAEVQVVVNSWAEIAGLNVVIQ